MTNMVPIVADSNQFRIRRPEGNEAALYRDLLVAAGLPPDGLDACLRDALVAVDATGAVRGGVALEVYGEAALLRSLAVAPRDRGAGLGRRLVERVVELAADRGVGRLVLLTETAAAFFETLGFAPASRMEVPAAVQQSVQFRGACPQSAAVLTASTTLLRSRLAADITARSRAQETHS